jgi:hypothetical protein
MKILIGVMLYLFVVALFVAFGKFLKNCDDSISKGIMNNETKSKKTMRLSGT